MRQLQGLKTARQREAMALAIVEGRLTLRQMTPQERRQGDRDRNRVGRPAPAALLFLQPGAKKPARGGTRSVPDRETWSTGARAPFLS